MNHKANVICLRLLLVCSIYASLMTEYSWHLPELYHTQFTLLMVSTAMNYSWRQLALRRNLYICMSKPSHK